MAGSGGWIGVDLDGTLAFYTKWHGVDHVGPPIMPMIRRVKRWLEMGIEVRIVTARVGHPNEATQARRAIEDWCLEHIGQKLTVTCEKDFLMMELWDDRAVEIKTNTGQVSRCSHCGELYREADPQDARA